MSDAAAKRGVSTVVDIQFEYPIVADEQRVIHVAVEGESLTLSSSTGPDTPANRWVRHVSARISERTSDDVVDAPSEGHDVPAFDDSAIAELQRAGGVEGQPFPWSVDSCGSASGGLRAEISLSEASTVALLDAAVHVARLADSTNTALMLPAAVESICAAAELADAKGAVEVHRRGDTGDELVVDVVVKAPDGATIAAIRGLRYAPVESAPVQPAAETSSAPIEVPAWSQMSPEERLGELQTRLRAILARELGMPDTAVNIDTPFPELGLDSMMAMNLLRDAKQLVQTDLSATMLWNHPTISSFATYVAELLTPEEEPEEEHADVTSDSISLLDALFDSVESARAGSESGI
jgi:phthiocerol/phenolphthiocerol synthesis type-I polyketide synthase B